MKIFQYYQFPSHLHVSFFNRSFTSPGQHFGWRWVCTKVYPFLWDNVVSRQKFLLYSPSTGLSSKGSILISLDAYENIICVRLYYKRCIIIYILLYINIWRYQSLFYWGSSFTKQWHHHHWWTREWITRIIFEWCWDDRMSNNLSNFLWLWLSQFILRVPVWPFLSQFSVSRDILRFRVQSCWDVMTRDIFTYNTRTLLK